jgi:hypothetical protein
MGGKTSRCQRDRKQSAPQIKTSPHSGSGFVTFAHEHTFQSTSFAGLGPYDRLFRRTSFDAALDSV